MNTRALIQTCCGLLGKKASEVKGLPPAATNSSADPTLPAACVNSDRGDFGEHDLLLTLMDPGIVQEVTGSGSGTILR
jgi:hypothetical protein